MGDFDFLIGRYTVHHRRKAVSSLSADLAATSAAGWEEFEGVNTGAAYLGGQVIVDELATTFPDGGEVVLVDVHAYDPAADLWTNVIHVKGAAPDWSRFEGRFTAGVGVFEQVAADGLRIRHTWDRITGTSARFRQFFAVDGVWEPNWVMELRR